MGALQSKNQWIRKARVRYAQKFCFIQLYKKIDPDGKLYLDELYPWDESVRVEAFDEPIVFTGFTIFHKSKYLDHAEFTENHELVITPGQWIDINMSFVLDILDGLDTTI